MKKVLILGGTMFVGRALVEKLIDLNLHDVTLFNRGKSNSGLFSDVKQIHGNRETEDIQKALNENWDVVIDFSGYYPVTFEKLLQSLKGKVGRYIFISTISVYDLSKPIVGVLSEADEILACSEEQKVSKLPDAYGEKKAEMERLLLQKTGLDTIILRPSFIYGKYDWTQRFYYWLYRAKFSDKVLMPEEYKLSLTHADDLVQALINAIDAPHAQKIYNTISHQDISLRDVVKITAEFLDRKIEFVHTDAEELSKHDLNIGKFPLYVPFNLNIEGNQWKQDFNVLNSDFASTIKQTINFHDREGWSVPKVGLSIEKEKEILLH
jgi:2'-hydroxyisoflavone reductase